MWPNAMLWGWTLPSFYLLGAFPGVEFLHAFSLSPLTRRGDRRSPPPPRSFSGNRKNEISMMNLIDRFTFSSSFRIHERAPFPSPPQQQPKGSVRVFYTLPPTRQLSALWMSSSSRLNSNNHTEPLPPPSSPSTAFPKENPKQNDRGSPFGTVDGGLVAADVLALALAFQLLALTNILNDPEFWQQGGWWQPIPLVPPTLGSTLQRFSTNTVLYLGTAYSLGGLASSSSTTDNPFTAACKTALRNVGGYVVVQFFADALLGLVSDQFVSAEKAWLGDAREPRILSSFLQEAYFVFLAILTSRFLVAQLWR